MKFLSCLVACALALSLVAFAAEDIYSPAPSVDAQPYVDLSSSSSWSVLSVVDGEEAAAIDPDLVAIVEYEYDDGVSPRASYTFNYLEQSFMGNPADFFFHDGYVYASPKSYEQLLAQGGGTINLYKKYSDGFSFQLMFNTFAETYSSSGLDEIIRILGNPGAGSSIFSELLAMYTTLQNLYGQLHHTYTLKHWFYDFTTGTINSDAVVRNDLWHYLSTLFDCLTHGIAGQSMLLSDFKTDFNSAFNAFDASFDTFVSHTESWLGSSDGFSASILGWQLEGDAEPVKYTNLESYLSGLGSSLTTAIDKFTFMYVSDDDISLKAQERPNQEAFEDSFTGSGAGAVDKADISDAAELTSGALSIFSSDVSSANFFSAMSDDSIFEFFTTTTQDNLDQVNAPVPLSDFDPDSLFDGYIIRDDGIVVPADSSLFDVSAFLGGG